ncbi:two-component system, chemotaxis family, response regulator CheB [Clostridium acidisoli DSM 12555]|uniref:Protein-glutamate methylesterase/protein-glutamine glutaminase n=1 Tax=Clostridium acidisoli DSM 12555 TaxID=1121291 RepID=A0A1W1X288_9CLOT|nr:chemotaxis response regulator protein-glutamate methylesterase [Clostridium acidisoli]SMC18024.1 two-component system, chemotaxis family, response regulator CheB [Clostridium acidisoli DSM 12555]
MKNIKVLVVDDSALMRKIISDILNEDPAIEVIDTARNGVDLFEKLARKKPDVITLDLEMPLMNGIEVLKKFKTTNINIPIIMLSSLTKEGTKQTMESLHYGAFDFISKPSGVISIDINKVADELILKVKSAYSAFSLKDGQAKTPTRNKIDKTDYVSKIQNTSFGKIKAVVIGASTGGPKALYNVITKLPKLLGVPVFVVQHMPVGFTKAFAERLDANSEIKVVEASDGITYDNNVVYIAPGGYHMEVWNDGKIHLNTEPSIWGVRPAVDKLFISASKVYGPSIVSAVLTGMGRDGAEGTSIIKQNGGYTISEAESTCVIYGMPKMAFETGAVDFVLPIDKVADEIVDIVKGRR